MASTRNRGRHHSRALNKPTRSYLFAVSTTFNDVPYRHFHTLAAARKFQADFRLSDEVYAELNDLIGGGIGDVVGLKIFLIRGGVVSRCWSEDFDWLEGSCSGVCQSAAEKSQ